MMERGITQHRQEMKTVGVPRAATVMKIPEKLTRATNELTRAMKKEIGGRSITLKGYELVQATNKLTRRMKRSDEIAQKMRAFIDRIGGRCITPEEDELKQALLQKSNIVERHER